MSIRDPYIDLIGVGNNQQSCSTYIRYLQVVRWRQPPRVTRILQLNSITSGTRYNNSMQMH